MRTICAAVLAVTLAGAAAPARAADPAPAAPTTPLAGYWKAQVIEFEGQQQVDAKSGSLLTLVVKGAEYRVYYCKDAAKDEHYRLFTASVAVNAADGTFELTVADGPKKGEPRHGIFSVSGNTLRLCYGPADKPRPATFAAPKGSGMFNEVWVLEKK